MYLDGDNRAEIERYVVACGLVRADGLPIAVERAGAGNMNLALRVTPATGRSFILKQGRPWVEKYKQIPAPFERTLVEAAFYSAVAIDPCIAGRMPAVLHLDRNNHVLVLEDIGDAGDFTSIYSDAAIPGSAIGALLEWLECLAAVSIPADGRAILANRAMRALNHEHMFRFPLVETNGLDLDGITRACVGRRASLRPIVSIATRLRFWAIAIWPTAHSFTETTFRGAGSRAAAAFVSSIPSSGFWASPNSTAPSLPRT
jgi:5-methylthioribose kinase